MTLETYYKLCKYVIVFPTKRNFERKKIKKNKRIVFGGLEGRERSGVLIFTRCLLVYAVYEHRPLIKQRDRTVFTVKCMRNK